MKRLGQVDLWIPDGVPNGIVLLLPGKGQLRERRLVARRLLDVDKVLVVRDAVVFRQFEQADEGLEQRGPGRKVRNKWSIQSAQRSTRGSDAGRNPDVSPEFCVLGVHHRGTFREDFSDADSADLLLDGARHLLNLRNNDLLQNHAKHSATKCQIEQNIYLVIGKREHSSKT